MKRTRNTNKKAFTLAEVLITLVIIGIIAAITVPTIMANSRKIEVETRLKQTYSILNNALTRAVADNGPIHTWDDIKPSLGIDSVVFYKNYLQPYLVEGVSLNEDSSYKEWGYKSIKTPQSDDADVDKKRALATLANGATIIDFDFGWYYGDSIDDAVGYAGVCYFIDINGLKGPNYGGKDIFGFTLMFTHKYPKFEMQGVYMASDLSEDDMDKFIREDPEPATRYYQMNNCKKGATTCGALIQLNGWKIPKDYPINI